MIAFYLNDGSWITKQTTTKWKRSILSNLHRVDVDSFGDPMLVVEDYMIKELSENNEKGTVTVVIPFAKEWPNQFMSCFHT